MRTGAPRRRTQSSRLFGKSTEIVWIDQSNVATQAAQLQHAYALAIRDLAVDRFGSVRKYADGASIAYEYLLDILRGDVSMRLDVIAEAESILGGVHLRAMRYLGVVDVGSDLSHKGAR